MEMRILYLLLVGFFSLAFLFVAFAVIAGKALSGPGYEGPVSDHFNGTTFVNTGEVPSKNFTDVLKWYLRREQGPWKMVPEAETSFATPQERIADDRTVVTYVNHSTFLIQTGGFNILTDPIWAERASPFSFAGPKRFRPPGIRFEDLPPIDLIVISHNHYDHLDINTLKRLSETFDPQIIAPLGVTRYLNDQGIQSTTELDWWEAQEVADSLTLHAVPAQHFSGRGLFDRDHTLWAGYIIEAGDRKIYFAGDTGYGEIFKEIGKRFAPVDLALIPIGAYQPRWFMKPMHVDPSEALQIFKDVGAQQGFGMHYGTFPMADDGMDDPVRDLEKAKQSPDNRDLKFDVLREGMIREIK